MHICVADRRHRAASVFACICVCVCGRAHVTPAATRPSVNTWNTGCTRVCVHALRLSAARGWARIFRRGYFPRDKSVFVSFRIFDISRIFPSFFLSFFLYFWDALSSISTRFEPRLHFRPVRNDFSSWTTKHSLFLRSIIVPRREKFESIRACKKEVDNSWTPFLEQSFDNIC